MRSSESSPSTPLSLVVQVGNLPTPPLPILPPCASPSLFPLLPDPPPGPTKFARTPVACRLHDAPADGWSLSFLLPLRSSAPLPLDGDIGRRALSPLPHRESAGQTNHLTRSDARFQTDRTFPPTPDRTDDSSPSRNELFWGSAVRPASWLCGTNFPIGGEKSYPHTFAFADFP